jgi:hypothetical protein
MHLDEILIGTVGATAHQAAAQVDRPGTLRHMMPEFRKRVGQVRGEWAVDMRLKL